MKWWGYLGICIFIYWIIGMFVYWKYELKDYLDDNDLTLGHLIAMVIGMSWFWPVILKQYVEFSHVFDIVIIKARYIREGDKAAKEEEKEKENK